MRNLLFALLIFTSIILSNAILAQNSSSLQLNGGIVMPMSSSKGFNALIQFNYHFGNNIQLYIYSGYSSWDKFNINFLEDWSTVQKKTLFNSYSSDEHVLIPIYVGSRINFHTNKFFVAFVIFEIGFSHLSYNNYEIKKEINSVSGEVLSYNPDLNTKKEMKENLLGIGTGFGLSHQIKENINLVLFFKLNSQLNSPYYGFFSSKGTYTAFNLGLNFKI